MHFSISFFFFNDTATTEIYTLSLHDALPIFPDPAQADARGYHAAPGARLQRLHCSHPPAGALGRSEEHTSELQSQSNIVCRLLLEKKKKKNISSSTRVFEGPASRIHYSCTAY